MFFKVLVPGQNPSCGKNFMNSLDYLRVNGIAKGDRFLEHQSRFYNLILPHLCD